MANKMTTFEFIGELATPKEPIRIDKYEKGVSTKLSMFVKKDKICSAFMEISDFKGEKVYPIKMKFKANKDVDAVEIQVPYADRNKEENIEIAPDYVKRVLDLEENQELKDELSKLRYKIRDAKWNNKLDEEFEQNVKEYKEKCKNRTEVICDEDYIKLISDNIDVLKDKKVRILGNLKMEVNKKNGNVYRKFIPNLIEFASDDMANKLEVKAEYVFGEEAVNDDNFDETKLVNIMGYIEDYDPINKSRKLFPLPLVIDGSKIDPENTMHMARLNIFKDMLSSEEGFSKLPIVISYYRGGKQIEFSEDMLTDSQRAMIEAGLATVDSYRPKGGVIGDNVEFFKLVNMDLSGDYKNGALKTFEDEDLSKHLFIFNEDVIINTKTEEVVEVKQEVKSSSVSDELMNLFD